MVIAFLRTIILYLLIIAGIRLMGKRQVGELEPSELVLALIIADLAAVPMQDFGIPLLTGIIPILTLLCITMLLSVLTMHSVKFRALVCGRPSIIVENGRLHQREMKKNRFTIDELMEELRMKGVTDLSTVKYAILETNGQVSVLPYANQLPATAEQMNVTPDDVGLPLVIVNDGPQPSHARAGPCLAGQAAQGPQAPQPPSGLSPDRGRAESGLSGGKGGPAMKRAWIALAILCAVFAAALYSGYVLRGFTEELTGLLTLAQTQAEHDAWNEADELTRAAAEKWEAQDAYLHVTLRHADTDSIYTSFREVEEFLESREQGEYSAANARLIALIELLNESEQLTLKNIL